MPDMPKEIKAYRERATGNTFWRRLDDHFGVSPPETHDIEAYVQKSEADELRRQRDRLLRAADEVAAFRHTVMGIPQDMRQRLCAAIAECRGGSDG